ncbi:MAG: UbiA family prenyltransferase [Candidatus Thermoplasmatota archaeon]
MNKGDLEKTGIGIKARYPNIPLSRRMRAFIQLLRPYTLFAPLFAVLFGAIAQMGFAGELHLLRGRILLLLLGGLALMIAQASGQVSNQACDPPELDRINDKGYRPIPSGVISQEEAISIGWGLALLSVAIAFLIGDQFGILVSLMFVVIVAYNFEPLRLKKRLWLNNISMAFSRGLLPLPAAWAIFGDVLNPLPWMIGSCIFFWVVGWQSAKDIDDVEGDAEYDINTPAVYYGVKRLKKILVLPSLASFGVLTFFLVLEMIPSSFSILLLLAVPTLVMHKYIGENKAIALLENNIVWQLFYLVLGGWFLLTAVAVLL